MKIYILKKAHKTDLQTMGIFRTHELAMTHIKTHFGQHITLHKGRINASKCQCHAKIDTFIIECHKI
jgi:hypothetical protein